MEYNLGNLGVRPRQDDNIEVDLKVRVRTVFIWLVTGSSGELFERGNEPSSSIKDGGIS
jgi:hypothetical protein